MLGICFSDKEFTELLTVNSRKSFSKTIGLLPNEEIRMSVTNGKPKYFIQKTRGVPKLKNRLSIVTNIKYLCHLPDPVYNVGQRYYVKESLLVNGKRTNKAHMKQSDARYFIEITDCNVVCVPELNLAYEYDFKFVEK